MTDIDKRTVNHNLYSLFFDTACGEAPLLMTASGEVTSYAAMDEASARIARLLADLGLRPGDRVTVQVRKSPAVVALYLACLRAGLVFHPLNDDYRREELAFLINDAEPALAICDPQSEALFAGLLPARRPAANPCRGRQRHSDRARPAECGALRHRNPAGRRSRHPALHLRHHGQAEGRDDHSRQSRRECRSTGHRLGLQCERPPAPRPAALSRPWAVRRARLHAPEWREHAVPAEVRGRHRHPASAGMHGHDGRADLLLTPATRTRIRS